MPLKLFFLAIGIILRIGIIALANFIHPALGIIALCYYVLGTIYELYTFRRIIFSA